MPSPVTPNDARHPVQRRRRPWRPRVAHLKAARILAATPAYAFFAKRGRPGHARAIASAHLPTTAEALRFDYPFTTKCRCPTPAMLRQMTAFYEQAAATIGARLDAGTSVAILCEGDPFFYGSAMYLFDRLVPPIPA